MMHRPLVLLHPLGADGSFWTPVLRELDDRHVLALDLPGHGRGAPLVSSAGLDEVAALVVAELDRRGVGECDVVGMALGGLVAQHLAINTPRRVTRLVLIGTISRYPEVVRQRSRERSALARRGGTAELVDATLKCWFTERFRREQGPEVRRAVDVLTAMDPESYARICTLCERADLSDRIEEIDVPTLVVCGDRDGAALLDGARSFAVTIPQVTSVLLAGKHAAVVEHPRVFADVLLDFLTHAKSPREGDENA